MKRYSNLSLFMKVILVVCICGLMCSGVALFFIYESSRTSTYISIDDYIAQVDNDRALESNEQTEQINSAPTPSSVNTFNDNKQGQLTSSEQTEIEHPNNLKVNINTATVEQLQQLKGIGPSKAKAIIEEREKGGSFKTIEEIKRVKGIGDKIFESIKESLVN